MGKTYTIRCTALNENFASVFSFNNATFETKGLLPGEKAEVSLLYGKDKGRAKVEKITEISEERINPVCPVYEKCGGCSFLHTSYENELRLKTEVCKKLLSDFGEVADCTGMGENSFHYRNKVHATLSLSKKGKVTSGLYEETSHQLVPVTECQIERTEASEVMKTIRKFMDDFRLPPYNEDTRRGTLRHVLFRISKTGETLVCLVCGTKIFPEKHRLADEIVKKHPFVKTVILNFNNKKTSFVLGDKDEILYGPGYVTDELCGIRFRISAHSFYQVNTEMAEKIYTDAVKLSGLGKDDTVLDAYCGIGTIAMTAAKLSGAKEMTGVELNPAAVRDARESAKNAGFTNLRFIDEDAGDFLSAAIGADLHYSCIIMDPPRSGAGENFLSAVVKMKPEKLIYISCNPATLARDLRFLAGKKYKAECIRPYDMFPHTANVEVLCILSRKPAAGSKN
ncbi:MAG: 23S rRNA (uracil(1939)-C(5))-methyltransferase RlmD [Lachnospiraceae bacterium]|nr:23S rRNA (uracil(1939)-C(5))-methyltransferase RlmD [Lachnospiraceae bacterium]